MELSVPDPPELSRISDLILEGRRSMCACFTEGDLTRDATQTDNVFILKRIRLRSILQETNELRARVDDERVLTLRGHDSPSEVPLVNQPTVLIDNRPHEITHEEALAVLRSSGDEFTRQVRNAISYPKLDSTLCTMVARMSSNRKRGRYSVKELQEITTERRTRASDDEWLRSPNYDIGELPCVSDKECEAYIMHGVIAVSRPTEEEIKEMHLNNKMPTVRRMCVRCQRYYLMRQYLAFMREGKNITDIIPPFFNTVEIEGEYCIEQCIVCGGDQNFQMLCAAMELSEAYTVEVDESGITYFRQTGYLKPTLDKKQPFV